MNAKGLEATKRMNTTRTDWRASVKRSEGGKERRD